MARYDIILLDADMTLMDFEQSEKEALARALEKWGLPHDDETCAAYSKINAALWAAMARGEVDLALTELQPQGDQLEYEWLYTCDFVLVLNKSDPLAAVPCPSYDDTADRRLIIDTSRVEPDSFIRNMRAQGVRSKVDSFVQDSGVLLSMIETGRCITHLPEVTLKELLLENSYPSVTRVALPDGTPPAHWGIAWNRLRPLSAEGLCFRDFVRGYFPSVDEAFARAHA